MIVEAADKLRDKIFSFAWLIIPISIILIDLIVRWNGKLPPLFWSQPESLLLSIALSTIFWWAISRLIANTRKPWLWSTLIAFPTALTLCAAWRYHGVASSDVSVGIILYAWGEPANASGLAAQGISATFTLATLALTVLWSASLALSQTSPQSLLSRRICLAMPFVWLLAALALPPGIPALGTPYVSDVHVSQVLGEAARRIAQGDVDTVLHLANRLPIPAAAPKERPNVIVIIGESVRYDRIGALGYERDTTPLMTQFFADNPDAIFRFDRAYTPSPYSPIAMASALTGLLPSRQKQEMHEAPILWQYAKAYDAHGFLITPQDWNIAGLSDFFLINGPPDTTITARELNAPAINDTGVHDLLAAEQLRTLLRDDLSKDELFLGVIKLNATHFPFLTAENLPWNIDNIRDRYDGAIRLTDEVFGILIETLQETNRLDNTIIIYTADHSEFFYNLGNIDLKEDNKIADLWRDGLRAQSCHPAVARVPMWLYVPKPWQSRLDIDATALRDSQYHAVSNIDIVPTVLDALSLEEFAQQADFPSLDGRSLLRPIPPDRAASCFTSARWVRWMPIGIALFGPDYAVYSREDFPEMLTFDLSDPQVFNESIAGIPPTHQSLNWAQKAVTENPDARYFFEALGQYQHSLWPIPQGQ